jgi:hypothetical protein
MKRSTMTMATLALLSFAQMGVALADETRPALIEQRQDVRAARQEERQERRRVRAGRTTVTLVDDGEAFEDVISRIRAERRQQKADPTTTRSDNTEKPLPVEEVRMGGAEPTARERRAEVRLQRRDPTRVREQRQRIRERVREIKAKRKQ